MQITRVTNSYQEALLRRNSQVFDYIRVHRQSGDIVLSPLSSVSLGKLDYYLFPVWRGENFDSAYWRDGRLIDRWGGGVIVNNLDHLNRIIDKSQHIWINIDDVRNPRANSDLGKYIQILGKPVINSFGTHLRLWKPEDGLPNRIPNKGKDLGAY